jgi:hypothetical protein
MIGDREAGKSIVIIKIYEKKKSQNSKKMTKFYHADLVNQK